MRKLTDNLLVILPRLSVYAKRNDDLSKAYVNLVEFFQKRYGIETHVISSAESFLIVPSLDEVKIVQAVHPADVEFFNHYIMLLEKQDIKLKDAFDAAAKKIPLRRGLSVEERYTAVAEREKTAVKHIARKHYDMVVDFESQWNPVYQLKPKVAQIYFRVSSVNFTVEAFFNGKPIDLCGLLEYDGAKRPLGAWDERGAA